MAKLDQTLLELRCADAVLARAGRLRPSGYRCSLGERGGGVQLSAEQIEWAENVAAMVRGIAKPGPRRAVSLCMATDHGRPVYSFGQIGSLLGVDVRTISRWISKGADEVRSQMEQRNSVLINSAKRDCEPVRSMIANT